MFLVDNRFQSLKPYQAGKPISEVKRELGLDDIIKLASNENCYGPSPKSISALTSELSNLQIYPDSSGWSLKTRLCQFHKQYNICPENIVLGNGIDELISMTVSTFLCPGEAVLNVSPTFPAYHLRVQASGFEEQVVSMDASLKVDVKALLAAIRPNTKLIFLANPQNPSGSYLDKADFETLMAGLPQDVILFLDEAYREYSPQEDFPDSLSYLSSHPRMLIAKTFSKIYGLAGLRVGYLLTSPDLADYLNRNRAPFNVNTLGQIAALEALDDNEYVASCYQKNRQEIAWLYQEYDRLGLSYWPTVTNFILVKISQPADDVFQKLLHRGIIVRSMANNGLADCLRITVGTHEQNVRLIKNLEEVLNGAQ